MLVQLYILLHVDSAGITPIAGLDRILEKEDTLE
jgi:hypothetical protein